ncbi:hypothetical protein ABQF34_07135 [Mycolicibacterium boenickei]
MEQLTALAAEFLEAEDCDRHTSLAIGAIAVLVDELASGRWDLCNSYKEVDR